jgi:hypothetical protein
MKKLCFIAAVLVVVGVFLVSCAKEQAPAEIKVGVIHAQSGMFAAFGQGGVFGIKAAVDDVNKQGGVKVGDKKMPIKLVIVDSESDPNKVGALAENLINQGKVQFIVQGDEPPPMHAGVSMAADRFKIPYVMSTHGALVGHEAGDSDKMAVHLGDGPVRDCRACQGRGFPGETRVHGHGYMDSHARSLWGSDK